MPPIARKLGVRPGGRVLLVDGSPGWTISDLPDGTALHTTAGPVGPAPEVRPDLVVAFFREASDLAAQAARLGAWIFPAGMLWIAWPRRAAGHESDITENLVRDVVLPLGLVDTKVAALGEDWSGLRVVWRRERR